MHVEQRIIDVLAMFAVNSGQGVREYGAVQRTILPGSAAEFRVDSHGSGSAPE